MIEANVLVNLFESIAREVIFQGRRRRLGRLAAFNGLLLPQSWALDIVRHFPQVDQQGWSTVGFLDALCRALEYIHSYEPGIGGKPSGLTLYGFQGFLSVLSRGILISRICRILILVAINLPLGSDDRDTMCTEIVRVLRGPGTIHNILCEKFAQASSWDKLLDALQLSPLQRGADRLVYTVQKTNATSDYYPRWAEQIIYDKIKPDLENLLASTDQNEVGANGTVTQPEQNAEVKESDH
ncbi:hypothetical protein FRC12_004521 [Ceratobasidium sp. 428]|nr:hypothetical protein FRC12_004521 [Ceratobasidium sp. 428]